MKSKPTFRVDLVRKSTTVSISCSFIEAAGQEEGYGKIFNIETLIKLHDVVFFQMMFLESMSSVFSKENGMIRCTLLREMF